MLFFKKNHLADGLRECQETPGGILVDVRESSEYASGHIPGAVSLPLSEIQRASFPKETPLFLYCLRGARSRRAKKLLKGLGYRHVKSIGGIREYQGPLET